MATRGDGVADGQNALHREILPVPAGLREGDRITLVIAGTDQENYVVCEDWHDEYKLYAALADDRAELVLTQSINGSWGPLASLHLPKGLGAERFEMTYIFGHAGVTVCVGGEPLVSLPLARSPALVRRVSAQGPWRVTHSLGGGEPAAAERKRVESH